jgi:hypothetical protein
LFGELALIDRVLACTYLSAERLVGGEEMFATRRTALLLGLILLATPALGRDDGALRQFAAKAMV